MRKMPICLVGSEIFAIFVSVLILDLILLCQHKSPTEAGLSVWATKPRGRSRGFF